MTEINEINEICSLSEILLKVLQKNELLNKSINILDHCKVIKLLNNSFSLSQNQNLDIMKLHNLYVTHTKHKITSIHFLEFIKCLKEAYVEVSSNRIESNPLLCNMLNTLEKFIEYENEPALLLIEQIVNGIENGESKDVLIENLQMLKEIVENYQMRN